MAVTVIFGNFEWDKGKEAANIKSHDVDFYSASLAFLDPHRVIAVDELHSQTEPRYFCIGLIGNKAATVRFTYRKNRIRIRIIGAGFWRKGKKLYEEENQKRRS